MNSSLTAIRAQQLKSVDCMTNRRGFWEFTRILRILCEICKCYSTKQTELTFKNWVLCQWDRKRSRSMIFSLRIPYITHFSSFVNFWYKNEALLWHCNNTKHFINHQSFSPLDRTWWINLLRFRVIPISFACDRMVSLYNLILNTSS